VILSPQKFITKQKTISELIADIIKELKL